METEFLKERAESFLRDADFAIKEKRWFAAAFHLEQSSQLYLKYFLFRKIRDFPRTHSLKYLLELVGKAYDKEKEAKTFLEKHKEVISDLEEAYITSHYLPIEFYESKIKEMRKFVKGLLKFLRKL